ncbi:MAG: FHA domain-containing protein [Planctomycetes bacterium]|nr:FHA domain-containing protein [Planctomycetota bacterium]
MPRIVFKNSEHAPVDLTEAVTLGRSAQHSNVVVKDNRLSRAHCRFEPRDDGWSIVDLESQNGTFLNGRRVRESLVKAGDVVTIGTADIIFEETGGPGGRTVMAGVQSTRGTQALDLADDSVAKPTSEKVDSTRTVLAPAALVLAKGTLQDNIHPITQDVFKIGRKHDNELCLENDGKASGHHANITRKGQDYIIEDLGSTNGVVVNGKRIEGPVVLQNGMKVLLGQQLFRFQLQGRDPVSSGRTAPELASADIQARLKPPGQAGDDEDMSELDEPAEHATIHATPEEQAAANEEDDIGALTQEIKFKGGGSALFAIVEVLVVVVVLGGVLFAAWTMVKDDNDGAGAGGGNYPPARDGGLLAENPSFDEADESGFPKGWSYSLNETDSFALVEGAHGGQFAMQISRFSASNSASTAISPMIEAPGGGVKVSVFAINSESASGRLGSAFVSVYWYASRKEKSPRFVTPVTAATNLSDWTELSGSAAKPPGVGFFSVALSLRGTPGSVAFDDVQASEDNAAQDWFEPQSIGAPNGMKWLIGRDGGITLEGPEGNYISNGQVLMYQSENGGDPLVVQSHLIEKPSFVVGDNTLKAAYTYFDPIAASPMKLNLELGRGDNRARLTGSVSRTGSGGEKAARFVVLYADVTPAWAPAEFVRFEATDDRPREYAFEVGSRGSAGFSKLLSADTATGNVIHAAGGSPKVRVRQDPGGRTLILTDDSQLNVTFERATGRDELNELASLIAAVQPGEDQMDRVNRAVRIFDNYLYNQNEVAAAAAAIDAAGMHYSLRLIELRDGINVPQLTRNEQLYRSAMEEAITSADKLNGESKRWETGALPVLRGAVSDHMLERTKQSATLARDSLRDLIEIAADFEQLAAVARRSLFALEIETEQRDSEPFLTSARDFLDSGQYIQGMMKLRAVVVNYPRCVRGIEAKERMVDVAGILLDEMGEHEKLGLKNIARDRALQARWLLDLVESKLLSNLLNETQKQWLRDPNLPVELDPSGWINREADLAKRIGEMRARLPKDLPPPEDSGNEEDE